MTRRLFLVPVIILWALMMVIAMVPIGLIIVTIITLAVLAGFVSAVVAFVGD